MSDLPVGAYVASALAAANYPGDSGDRVDRFLDELAKRGYRVAASQPPSGDAPDLREAAQEVIGAFTIAPGVTTGRQAKALEALRLAALAASAPSSSATPAPLPLCGHRQPHDPHPFSTKSELYPEQCGGWGR